MKKSIEKWKKLFLKKQVVALKKKPRIEHKYKWIRKPNAPPPGPEEQAFLGTYLNMLENPRGARPQVIIPEKVREYVRVNYIRIPQKGKHVRLPRPRPKPMLRLPPRGRKPPRGKLRLPPRAKPKPKPRPPEEKPRFIRPPGWKPKPPRGKPLPKPKPRPRPRKPIDPDQRFINPPRRKPPIGKPGPKKPRPKKPKKKQPDKRYH